MTDKKVDIELEKLGYIKIVSAWKDSYWIYGEIGTWVIFKNYHSTDFKICTEIHQNEKGILGCWQTISCDNNTIISEAKEFIKKYKLYKQELKENLISEIS